MTSFDSRIASATICLTLAMAGCAITPDRPVAAAGDELKHKNMDVLFATEFPVSSIDEALSIAAQAQAAGDIDRAIFYYVRALQFDESNVNLLTHIGDIHMHRGDNVMAKRAYLLARKLDPDFAPAIEALGLIYMGEGSDEEAIAHLSLAISADEFRWRAHNALGVYADKKGDYVSAQSHYRVALTLNPDAVHVLANLGYSKFLAGNVEAAILDLYKAANDRGFDSAWGNLATVYATQGDYADAVVAFEKVMSSANAYNSAGKIAMTNGDLQHAFELLSQAINRSSTYFPDAEESMKKLKARGVAAQSIHIAENYGGNTGER